MTLSIAVYAPSADLPRVWNAGFEDYRREVWGSSHLKQGGLKLLPQIAGDLRVHKSDFVALLDEVKVLEGMCHAIYAEPAEQRWWDKYRRDLLDYVNNFREAVDYAVSVGADDLIVC